VQIDRCCDDSRFGDCESRQSGQDESQHCPIPFQDLWDWTRFAVHAETDRLIGLPYVAISATLASLAIARDATYQVLLAVESFIVAWAA
jgi:hypothetical protein